MLFGINCTVPFWTKVVERCCNVWTEEKGGVKTFILPQHT